MGNYQEINEANENSSSPIVEFESINTNTGFEQTQFTFDTKDVNIPEGNFDEKNSLEQIEVTIDPGFGVSQIIPNEYLSKNIEEKIGININN